MVNRLWRKFGFAPRPAVIDAANRSERLIRDTNDLSGVFVSNFRSAALACQGATREHPGSIRPRSNAAQVRLARWKVPYT